MTLPKITLLLTQENDNALLASAEEICTILSTKFGLKQVTVRSASAAIERLLGNTNDNDNNTEAAMWVLLGPKNVQLQSVLEQEARVPVYSAAERLDDSPATVALEMAKWCSLASRSSTRKGQPCCISKETKASSR